MLHKLLRALHRGQEQNGKPSEIERLEDRLDKVEERTRLVERDLRVIQRNGRPEPPRTNMA